MCVQRQRNLKKDGKQKWIKEKTQKKVGDLNALPHLWHESEICFFDLKKIIKQAGVPQWSFHTWIL